MTPALTSLDFAGIKDTAKNDKLSLRAPPDNNTLSNSSTKVSRHTNLQEHGIRIHHQNLSRRMALTANLDTKAKQHRETYNSLIIAKPYFWLNDSDKQQEQWQNPELWIGHLNFHDIESAAVVLRRSIPVFQILPKSTKETQVRSPCVASLVRYYSAHVQICMWIAPSFHLLFTQSNWIDDNGQTTTYALIVHILPNILPSKPVLRIGDSIKDARPRWDKDTNTKALSHARIDEAEGTGTNNWREHQSLS